jgi:hypothetical protein
MNPRFPCLALLLAALVSAGGFASLTLRAEEKAKTPERPPLTLKADPKAINRDAPDRISYASIVKKTAPSVVYVFSSKKTKIAAEKGDQRS